VPLPPGSAVMTTAAAAPDVPPPPDPFVGGAPQQPVIYPAPPIPPPPLPSDTFVPVAPADPTNPFGHWMQGWGGNGPDGGCFESDHCFDQFASPVSNPFYFEDPRSLTEARPIFLFQTIPNSNPLFLGGNAVFYGTQFRLAVTERWSFVLNKLGGVSINPGHDSPLGSETGFAELWLGPKYTFLRNTDTGTVAAAGLTFQIPTGPGKVYQDTGSLSLVPYVTAGQNCLKSQFGSCNIMGTLGYSFRTDNDRSDFLFNSLHLDYDVANLHRIYPLVELNWFHYTRSGDARPLTFEGRDLANMGAAFVDGRNNFTIATGVRYKFSEHTQTGIVFEFPLNGTKDMLNFRLGVDLIFRY
jgi:hypothetical protein